MTQDRYGLRIREEQRRNDEGDVVTVYVLERPSTNLADAWEAVQPPFDSMAAAEGALKNHTSKGNVAVLGRPAGAVEATTTYDTVTKETTLPAWEGKMGPDEYLKRYPDGPKADLARELVGDDA